MESPLKQRLIGAAVLAALAIVFLPALLDGPDVKDPDAAEVPLTMPASPDDKFETRELTLGAPEATPPGGVLGMDAVPAPGEASVATTSAQPVGPAGAPVVTPVTPSNPTPVAPTPAPTTAPIASAPTLATPAPDAAPAQPVPPASVAGGNYALNVGTYTNVDNANALVSRLRAARLPVTTEPVRLNGGAAVRVRVGPYADRAAAEAARLRTDESAGGSSKVITLDGRALATAPKPALPSTLPKPAAPTPVALRPVAPTPAPVPAASGASGLGSPAAASGYAVQLAAPAEEAAALGLRDRARSAGFTAFVQRVDTAAGARFRVRLGPTADRAAADALRDSANSKLGISGNVVSHP